MIPYKRFLRFSSNYHNCRSERPCHSNCLRELAIICSVSLQTITLQIRCGRKLCESCSQQSALRCEHVLFPASQHLLLNVMEGLKKINLLELGFLKRLGFPHVKQADTRFVIGRSADFCMLNKVTVNRSATALEADDAHANQSIARSRNILQAYQP